MYPEVQYGAVAASVVMANRLAYSVLMLQTLLGRRCGVFLTFYLWPCYCRTPSQTVGSTSQGLSFCSDWLRIACNSKLVINITSHMGSLTHCSPHFRHSTDNIRDLLPVQPWTLHLCSFPPSSLSPLKLISGIWGGSSSSSGRYASDWFLLLPEWSSSAAVVLKLPVKCILSRVESLQSVW